MHSRRKQDVVGVLVVALLAKPTQQYVIDVIHVRT